MHAAWIRMMKVMIRLLLLQMAYVRTMRMPRNDQEYGCQRTPRYEACLHSAITIPTKYDPKHAFKCVVSILSEIDVWNAQEIKRRYPPH